MEIEIRQFLQAADHSVLFTTSFRSELQSIENIREQVKGPIAKNYRKDVKFSEVSGHLCNLFKSIESEELGFFVSCVIRSVSQR